MSRRRRAHTRPAGSLLKRFAAEGLVQLALPSDIRQPRLHIIFIVVRLADTSLARINNLAGRASCSTANHGGSHSGGVGGGRCARGTSATVRPRLSHLSAAGRRTFVTAPVGATFHLRRVWRTLDPAALRVLTAPTWTSSPSGSRHSLPSPLLPCSRASLGRHAGHIGAPCHEQSDAPMPTLRLVIDGSL